MATSRSGGGGFGPALNIGTSGPTPFECSALILTIPDKEEQTRISASHQFPAKRRKKDTRIGPQDAKPIARDGACAFASVLGSIGMECGPTEQGSGGSTSCVCWFVKEFRLGENASLSAADHTSGRISNCNAGRVSVSSSRMDISPLLRALELREKTVQYLDENAGWCLEKDSIVFGVHVQAKGCAGRAF